MSVLEVNVFVDFVQRLLVLGILVYSNVGHANLPTESWLKYYYFQN